MGKGLRGRRSGHNTRDSSPTPPYKIHNRLSKRSSSVERKEYAYRRSDCRKQSHNRPTPYGDDGIDNAFNAECHHLPAISLGAQRSLSKNSMYLDGSAARSFYTLPPDNTGYLSNAAVLKSENNGGEHENMNVGCCNSEIFLSCGSERNKESIYPKDISLSLVPSSQGLAFGSTFSSSLAKDQLPDLYRDSLHHPYDGFSRTIGVSKVLDDHLEGNGYHQVHHSDKVKQGQSNLPTRDGSQSYTNYDISRSERSGQGYLASDNAYKHAQWADHDGLTDAPGSSSMDLAGDRIDIDLSHKNLSENGLWDQRHSLHGDAAVDYRGMKVVREENFCDFGSERTAFKMKSSHDGAQPHSLRGDATMDYCDMKVVLNDNVSGLGSRRDAFMMKSSRDDDQRRTLHRDAAMDYHELKVIREDNICGSGSGCAAFRVKLSQNDDQRHSLRGDAAMEYRDTELVREDNVCVSGSRHAAFKMKSSGDDEFAPFEDEYALKRESASMAYRKRPRSPLLSDHRHMDTYPHGMSPSQGMDYMYYNDLSSEMMVRRKHIMDRVVSQFDSGGHSNDRCASRTTQSPSGSDDIWSGKDKEKCPPSKRLSRRPLEHTMSASRISRSGTWLPSVYSPARNKGGRGTSLKKRLRPCPAKFHDSSPTKKGHDSFNPHKFWKKGSKEHHTSVDSLQHDASYGGPLRSKTDPPEDSEEFKNQVHKAFLRFSKVLNENLHQQKRYREQGKAGYLLCFVCGSHSKDFVDTHSLLIHTYNSRKVGLRTKHLGLHKALCILMGWNWLVPPGTGKLYQSSPVAEAKALREDLILWPPVVIIHNSSIRNKIDANEAKVVSIEGMEEILKDMGFGGKARVHRGKPANQSVFLVKFMPTFSGLQEAERLHKHYADNKRSRQELQQFTANSCNNVKANMAQVEQVEELLYGYMAVAEDLDKLGPETKKRCIVKSRKDIEAIADAPLGTD